MSERLDRNAPVVVLASTSETRATLLRNAGVCHAAVAPGVDEEEVTRALLGEGAAPAHVAEVLAELKALHVSRRHPDAFVIGADQILEYDGRIVEKPGTSCEARKHLLRLRGQPHSLVTSACVARAGARIWACQERATLTMRDFSEDFLERYIVEEGDAILGTSGAYRIEGRGVQLFSHVKGSHFAILGLPLLPLLDFLRVHGVVDA